MVAHGWMYLWIRIHVAGLWLRGINNPIDIFDIYLIQQRVLWDIVFGIWDWNHPSHKNVQYQRCIRIEIQSAANVMPFF